MDQFEVPRSVSLMMIGEACNINATSTRECVLRVGFVV